MPGQVVLLVTDVPLERTQVAKPAQVALRGIARGHVQAQVGPGSVSKSLSVSLRAPLGSSTTAALPVLAWAIEEKRPAAICTLPLGVRRYCDSPSAFPGADGVVAGAPVTICSSTFLSISVGAITSTPAATATIA